MKEWKNKAEFSLLGDSWEEESESAESKHEDKSIEKLEQYKFYQGSKIRNSIKFSQNVRMSGEKLYSQGNIKMKNIFSGFDRYSSEIRGMVEAVGKAGASEFPIKIVFSRTAVKSADCSCPQCMRDYYSWDVHQSECPYKAGTLRLLEDYLAKYSLGDATDWKGTSLMTFYQKRRTNRSLADTEGQKESLRFVPRLTLKNGKLSVSFKIGEKKLFIVKKLDEFCENVKNSATETYGSSTQINHTIDNFTEQGKGWIRFINRIVREEEEFLQRIQESRYDYGYRKSGVGGSLNLFGWRLDEFYEQMAEDEIEFEDKDGLEKEGNFDPCGAQPEGYYAHFFGEGKQGKGLPRNTGPG